MRITILAAAVLLCSTALLFAPDKKTSGAEQPAGPAPSQEEMMAIMMKLGTPGTEHERLKAMEGTFDAEVTCKMAPEAPTMTSKGTMTNKMILGGRYFQGDFQGEFMGQPFTGMSLTGYDNAKNQYVQTWIDSMSTMMMISTGTADSSGKVITCKSTFDCPIAKGPKTMKSVTTIIDNNSHTYEAYDVGPDGKEFKTMTIKYTRAGDGSASR